MAIWARLRVVIEKDYHLSYPFLFEWEGQCYMMPETAENRTIELYLAVEFPNRWTLDRVLMDGLYAVDATLVFHNGRYWMFDVGHLRGQAERAVRQLHVGVHVGAGEPHNGPAGMPAAALVVIDQPVVPPQQRPRSPRPGRRDSGPP